jgi:ABC-type sulfate transport system substrate-binding protein
MDQKRLYKTIETVASKQFDSDEELLVDIVKQIVKNEQVMFVGGRIWKLDC